METIKNDSARDSPQIVACPRLVVKFRSHADVPDPETAAVNDLVPGDDTWWRTFQKKTPGLNIKTLFTSVTSTEISDLVRRGRVADASYNAPSFFAYHAVDCPDHTTAQQLLEALLRSQDVELAYLVHDSTPPQLANVDSQVSKISQQYLGPAPTGIDARYAWKISGGDGKGTVRFVDIEQGWLLEHESFKVNSLPITGLNHAFHDHGAAVLGVIVMGDNKIAGNGITPKAKGLVVSQWRPDGSLNNADAIIGALTHLKFGDIILLQAQVRDSSFHKNLYPAETHEATFQVIRLARALGVIVIEAAGNGDLCLHVGNDLDEFETEGMKILNRTDSCFRDSGAIMVAAASSGTPHRRIDSSNYGSRIDCYSWGENVATAGSFPGSSGNATNKYTKEFCGTSSAAAIIAGAAIAIQSIAEVNYKFRLNPGEMRSVLSSEEIGTSSTSGHTIDKIGVMPDLRKIIDSALPTLARGRIAQKKPSVLR